MSNFITIEDYDASIHQEILDSLVRSDAAVVEVCEDRAISEMRSYISQRYDADAIFSAEGSERHPLVLMIALDIAIYHIFCIHNPHKLSQIRKDRYDRAIEWLRAVGKGSVNIDGAKFLPKDELDARRQHLFGSNPKHTHHI